MAREDAAQRNGHVTRSAETRAKLIEAAIAEFGAAGFEGASTRSLTERAGAGLASISYHFGGKRELFRAAAEAIADYGAGLMLQLEEKLAAAALPGPAERAMHLTELFCHAIIAGEEPQEWVDFFVRAARQGPPEFQLIYGAIFGRFEALLAREIAALTGNDDEALRLRITILIAPIMEFRTNREALLARFNWPTLTPARVDQLTALILESLRASLLPADMAFTTSAPAGPAAKKRE